MTLNGIDAYKQELILCSDLYARKAALILCSNELNPLARKEVCKVMDIKMLRLKNHLGLPCKQQNQPYYDYRARQVNTRALYNHTVTKFREGMYDFEIISGDTHPLDKLMPIFETIIPDFTKLKPNTLQHKAANDIVQVKEMIATQLSEIGDGIRRRHPAMIPNFRFRKSAYYRQVVSTYCNQ